MADEQAQRAYRAACPNCGAPVEFRSAASALAVCSFCKSTLVREGEDLRRIGKSADLFADHSPLQLGVRGTLQGAAFTLVGRLQVAYAGGSWNEWYALFDGASDESSKAKAGWLSEDNGGYVFGFEAPAPAGLPAAEALRVGARLALDQGWTVSAITTARLAAAEGELPFVPALERAYVVAELRNANDEVASIEYPALGQNAGPKPPPRWTIGRSVRLPDLSLSGLREDGSRTMAGRTLNCPNCGAAIDVKLASTQSVTCPECKSVVDVSQGVGADLAHYAQDTAGVEGGEPLIPLGAIGALTLGAGGTQSWQVVGYVERCTVPGPEDDEQYFWREYLLYNAKAGFAFLVDADDGWSWVRPTTGAPTVGGIGLAGKSSAQWKGETYRETDRYTGQITYVLGEFYWRLERGQLTRNTDYTGPKGKKLNREQTGEGGDSEVTWSAGEPIDADVLLTAFKLKDANRAAMKRDAKPASSSGIGVLPAIFIVLLILAIVFSFSRCSRDDCDELRRTYGASSNEYQQCQRNSSYRGGGSGGGYGGSYGGFGGGGGGHK
jgi:ribosomal protein L37AE/L43A